MSDFIDQLRKAASEAADSADQFKDMDAFLDKVVEVINAEITRVGDHEASLHFSLACVLLSAALDQCLKATAGSEDPASLYRTTSLVAEQFLQTLHAGCVVEAARQANGGKPYRHGVRR